MKKRLIPILLLACTAMFSQKQYQKGYIINKENIKTECYILNMDWATNPESFKYKITPEADPQKGTPSTVSAFAIDSVFIYHSYTVRIDMSNDNNGNLSQMKGPEYEEKELFLKLHLSGKYSLYSYQGTSVKRFFLGQQGQTPEQLVYKRYQKTQTEVAINELYKGQLKVYLQGDENIATQIERTDYSEKSLTKLLESFYKNQDLDYSLIAMKKKSKMKSRINFRAGAGVSSLDVYGSYPFNNYSFVESGLLGLRIGMEYEAFLPFRNNSWAVIVEPMVHFERSSFMCSQTAPESYIEFNLNYLKLPVGFRKYFYIKERPGLFIDLGFALNQPLNSGIKYFRVRNGEIASDSYYDLQFEKMNIGLFAGLGYRYNDLSLSLRYDGINQNLTNLHNDFNVRYNSLTLGIAYGFNLGEN